MPQYPNLSGGYAERKYVVAGNQHTMRIQLQPFAPDGSYNYIHSYGNDTSAIITLAHVDSVVATAYGADTTFEDWLVHVSTGPNSTRIAGDIPTTVTVGSDYRPSSGKSKQTTMTFRTLLGGLVKVCLVGSPVFPLGPTSADAGAARTIIAAHFVSNSGITLGGRDGSFAATLANISTDVNKHLFRKIGY